MELLSRRILPTGPAWPTEEAAASLRRLGLGVLRVVAASHGSLESTNYFMDTDRGEYVERCLSAWYGNDALYFGAVGWPATELSMAFAERVAAN